MARAFRLPGPNYPSVFFHCVFDFANGLLSFTLLLLNSAFDFKFGVTGGLAYTLLDVANRFVRYAFDLVRSAAHDLTPFGSDVKVDASVDCESAQGVSLPIVIFMKRCAEHSHGGLWRDDAVPLDASVNLQWYVRQAKEAEAARFDFLFIVDSQYITSAYPHHHLNRFRHCEHPGISVPDPRHADLHLEAPFEAAGAPEVETAREALPGYRTATNA
jgi:hypothetical protein